MNPKWNPTIKTLVKNLEYIEKQNPAKMNSVPLSKVGFKWFWNFKDNGWLDVQRSESDGRSHIVYLTPAGKRILTVLQSIKMAEYLLCHRCGIPIDKFFKVPNKEWEKVTGDECDQVICKFCYTKMKENQYKITIK